MLNFGGIRRARVKHRFLTEGVKLVEARFLKNHRQISISHPALLIGWFIFTTVTAGRETQSWGFFLTLFSIKCEKREGGNEVRYSRPPRPLALPPTWVDLRNNDPDFLWIRGLLPLNLPNYSRKPSVRFSRRADCRFRDYYFADIWLAFVCFHAHGSHGIKQKMEKMICVLVVVRGGGEATGNEYDKINRQMEERKKNTTRLYHAGMYLRGLWRTHRRIRLLLWRAWNNSSGTVSSRP